MSEFSNELKARADIGKIIGEFVPLRPGGNGYVGLCPFHGEKTASLHVHAAKRFYYCFGCHAHGDVFQFLMALKQISFPEAVEQVAERLGVPVPSHAAPDDSPERADLLRIHLSAREYFESALAGREGVEARAYLQSRSIPPPLAGQFHLGYAPEHGRGLSQWLEQHRFPPQLAMRAGLCQLRRQSAERAANEPASAAPAQLAWADLYDRFRHRLIFPIHDERARPIAFGGRALATDARTPKYLNSPEHPLYTKGRVLYNLDQARAPIRDLGYTILVEGYFDCIRVSSSGFANVVATCGTALTSAQLRPLGRVNKKVAINFDPDAAGANAAERSIALLLEEGFQMRVVQLEGGLDPDLFLQRQGREAYAEALKSSRSFFDYLAERTRGQFDLRRGEGKLAAVNHILPYLSHVQDPILRQSMAENLAAQLGIEQPLISQELLRAARERRAQLPDTGIKAAEQAVSLLPAERVLLRVWLDDESSHAALERAFDVERLLAGLASAPIFEALRSGAEWSEDLPESDRRLVAEAMMETMSPDKEAALDALRRRRASDASRDLQRRIQAASAASDRVQLESLLREKSALDARRRNS
ncbi:MAG TPA: DNA primase [Terriglobales bacterium]|nr:DNA primase [Terriglobales bacterium]